MKLPIYTVNVFSERGITGGNQLGVILQTEELSDQQMQDVAKQLNYSESTFVSNVTPNSANVQIFLPDREIPFAGHPVVGTSFVLEYIWRQNNNPRDKLTLNLKAGPVDVSFENPSGEDIGICTLDQIEPKYIGRYEDHAHIADLLGIKEEDIFENPIPLIAPADLPFLFVPVRSMEVLGHLQPKFEQLRSEFEIIGGEPYVFSPQGGDGGDYRARFFAPRSGIDEDPATGSAQASFAMALSILDLLDHPNDGFTSFITEQGYEMGRPSKLYNNCEYINGNLVHTKTGGRNFLVVTGDITI